MDGQQTLHIPGVSIVGAGPVSEGQVSIPGRNGEPVLLDGTPFKLARARTEAGAWLLRIELLDPVLLTWFQEIVRRGANTFDMHEMTALRNLVDGIAEKPAVEETHEQKHLRIFREYVTFQEQKEKVMPLREMKFHMALGLSGELGELLLGFDIPELDKSRKNVEEELGDMLFFVTGLRRHYCPLHRHTSVNFADSQLRSPETNVPMSLVRAVDQVIVLVKKDLISAKPIDEVAMHAAISEVEFNMSKICKPLNIQLYDLAISNMNKLSKRYKDKFSAEESAARADKTETAADKVIAQAIDSL